MYSPVNSLEKSQLLMDLIAARQEAVSANIANMDTPNYVRKDIEFSQYLNTMNSNLETKLSQKLGPSGVMEPQSQTMTAEDELALMQKNSILYAIAARQMSNTITELKTVINVGK